MFNDDNPLNSIQHQNIKAAVRELAAHCFGNPPVEPWVIPYTAIVNDLTAKDGFDWDKFYREQALPLDLPKAKFYAVYAQTGCSCCSGSDNWIDTSTSLSDAWSRAQYSWDSKSVCSQYSDNGIYSIYEFEAERLPGNRLIFGDELFTLDERYYGSKAHAFNTYMAKHIYTMRDKATRDVTLQQFQEKQNEKV